MSNNSATEVDLIVVGAGAAGSTAASEARAQGARVAMVERWKVGGTCLNAGCDPTKALVRAATALHEARHAARFGIMVERVAADWPAVIDRVERVIDTIRGGDGDRNIREMGIDLRKGHASFRAPGEIEVNGELLRGDAVILAMGARAAIPPIPGLQDVGYLTNVEAVLLPALPAALAIIGTGVVALEFAQIFARFGVQVTMLGRNERLLPLEEPELAAMLRDVLADEGVRMETGVAVQHVERAAGRKRLVVQRQDGGHFTVDVDEILVAAGRVPNIEGMGLETVGVATNASGVVADAFLRTTAKRIWAAGDCVAGAPRYTPVADRQARVAAHNALRQPARPDDSAVVPVAIFTDPELGRVGLTEERARAAGYAVRAETVPMRDLARGVIAGETAGAVKLVADSMTGRVLGGSVLASGGAELLGEIALAVRLGLDCRAIAETMHAYPTLSEGVFWTAWEVAKPSDLGQEGTRGVESPRGDVAALEG